MCRIFAKNSSTRVSYRKKVRSGTKAAWRNLRTNLFWAVMEPPVSQLGRQTHSEFKLGCTRDAGMIEAPCVSRMHMPELQCKDRIAAANWYLPRTGGNRCPWQAFDKQPGKSKTTRHKAFFSVQSSLFLFFASCIFIFGDVRTNKRRTSLFTGAVTGPRSVTHRVNDANNKTFNSLPNH